MNNWIRRDALAHLIEEKEKEWGNAYLSLDDKTTGMALSLQAWASALQYVKHLVINFPSAWGDPDE